ncbi:hypothetical protein GCM10010346_21870 [Streptomyces chryseus]|uniref:Alpha/beta hydrolase n=1 Tax=Streptomyces chryseus TaxID=68186 RepID=A0ABQ3DLF8_9ACTN|nr:hypothetical protein GCM10010346_21870 [Streptomyces chryseus]
MPEIQLTAGTVAYEDTGGPGPVVVLLHGLVHDATVWRKVVADLRADHRVLAPTLPYGAHRIPMRPDVPLTPDSVAKRPVPDEILDGWLRPLLTEPAIRADFRRDNRGVRRTELLEAVDGLRKFDKPALVVWATEDRMMPRARAQAGRRTAAGAARRDRGQLHADRRGPA